MASGPRTGGVTGTEWILGFDREEHKDRMTDEGGVGRYELKTNGREKKVEPRKTLLGPIKL